MNCCRCNCYSYHCQNYYDYYGDKHQIKYHFDFGVCDCLTTSHPLSICYNSSYHSIFIIWSINIQTCTHIQASDQEVVVLALATLANILAFSDTLLLADVAVVDSLGNALPALMQTLRTSQQRPQRYHISHILIAYWLRCTRSLHSSLIFFLMYFGWYLFLHLFIFNN